MAEKSEIKLTTETPVDIRHTHKLASGEWYVGAVSCGAMGISVEVIGSADNTGDEIAAFFREAISKGVGINAQPWRSSGVTIPVK